MPAVRYNRAARAVGYIRVSKVGGGEGDSVISPQLQREQIEAVARREGPEVVEELEASGGDAPFRHELRLSAFVAIDRPRCLDGRHGPEDTPP